MQAAEWCYRYQQLVRDVKKEKTQQKHNDYSQKECKENNEHHTDW